MKIAERSILRRRSSSCLAAGRAHAAPELRVQVDQHGDFVLIGNTLGYECAARARPRRSSGTVRHCGANTRRLGAATCSGAPTTPPPGRRRQQHDHARPTRAAPRCSTSPRARRSPTRTCTGRDARRGAAPTRRSRSTARARRFTQTVNAMQSFQSGEQQLPVGRRRHGARPGQRRGRVPRERRRLAPTSST